MSDSCHPLDCSLLGSCVRGDSPGKNPGVGCHFLPQGIFPTQGPNQVSCTASRFFFNRLSYQGSPKYICILTCICVFFLKAHLTCKHRLLSHCEKVSKHPWSQFLHSCSQEQDERQKIRRLTKGDLLLTQSCSLPEYSIFPSDRK